MTVTALVTRNDITATASQTSFTYTFRVLADTDMDVHQNGVLLSSGYTVNNVGTVTGGTVVLDSGASAGQIVSLVLNMPLDRTTNYQNSGDFLAADVNEDFDKIYIGAVQNENSLDRSISLQEVEPTVSMSLPLKADRVGKYLYFNASTGSPEAGAVTPTAASDISYQRSETGSVATTVQAKLEESVSVKDFGATGDNDTDDTAAIQAALNTGKSVYIPIGDYKVSATIYLTTAGQRLYGESRVDSKIKRTNTTSPVLEMRYPRITIDNFTIQHTSLPNKLEIESARTSSNVGQGALLYWPETDGDNNKGKGWHTIRNMSLRNGYSGIENDWNATESGVFSAAFENIYCRQINGSFVLLNPGGSANSGCLWNNCYFANQRGDGILMNRAFDYREGANSSFNQLNIEACNVVANEVMYMQNIRGAVFDSIHVEDVTIAPTSATAGSFLNLTTSSSLVLGGVHINKLGVNTGTGAGQASHFSVFKIAGNGTQQPSFVATETSVRAVTADAEGVNALIAIYNATATASETTTLVVSDGVTTVSIPSATYTSLAQQVTAIQGGTGYDALKFDVSLNDAKDGFKFYYTTTVGSTPTLTGSGSSHTVSLSTAGFINGLNPTNFYLVNMTDSDLELSEGVSVGLNGVRSEKNITKAVYSSDADLENYGINKLEFAYFDGSSSATKIENYTTLNNIGNFIRLVDQSSVTIASGVITVTGANAFIDTEGSASTDDLDTINGGSSGDILICTANNGSRTVVLKDGSGNLKLAGDFSLDTINDKIVLIKNSSGNWCELSRSNNA